MNPEFMSACAFFGFILSCSLAKKPLSEYEENWIIELFFPVWFVIVAIFESSSLSGFIFLVCQYLGAYKVGELAGHAVGRYLRDRKG